MSRRSISTLDFIQQVLQMIPASNSVADLCCPHKANSDESAPKKPEFLLKAAVNLASQTTSRNTDVLRTVLESHIDPITIGKIFDNNQKLTAEELLQDEFIDALRITLTVNKASYAYALQTVLMMFHLRDSISFSDLDLSEEDSRDISLPSKNWRMILSHPENKAVARLASINKKPFALLVFNEGNSLAAFIPYNNFLELNHFSFTSLAAVTLACYAEKHNKGKKISIAEKLVFPYIPQLNISVFLIHPQQDVESYVAVLFHQKNNLLDAKWHKIAKTIQDFITDDTKVLVTAAVEPLLPKHVLAASKKELVVTRESEQTLCINTKVEQDSIMRYAEQDSSGNEIYPWPYYLIDDVHLTENGLQVGNVLPAYSRSLHQILDYWLRRPENRRLLSEQQQNLFIQQITTSPTSVRFHEWHSSLETLRNFVYSSIRSIPAQEPTPPVLRKRSKEKCIQAAI